MRLWIAIATLSLGLFAGCGEVDELLDCRNACSEFNDCLATDIDVTSCTDMCEDNTTHERADICDECVDANDNACASCQAECAGVVAIVTD